MRLLLNMLNFGQRSPKDFMNSSCKAGDHKELYHEVIIRAVGLLYEKGRLLAFLLLSLMPSFLISPAVAKADMWVSAYYAGWMQGCSSAGNGGHLKAQDIDYTALTHVIHFALEPYPDGTLNTGINCISSGNSAALVQAAHAAGKKVLISVGGWNTESDFLSATSNTHRAAFISNLIAFVKAKGYDGIDIDWEPLSPASGPQFLSFINALTSALNAISPRPLLTAAAVWEPSLFSQLQNCFDQINVMTYELSGPWPGWITWHNSPLYDGSCRFPSTGALVPSASGILGDFITAGVQPAKLGVGMEFYGAVWQGGTGTPTGGVTAPEQSWIAVPSMQMLPFYQIMDSYYQTQYYKWDAIALQSYLSINNSGSSQDLFISYDDEHSCTEKVNFAKGKGIGGVMIFELGGCWRPNQAVKDSLLQAVKAAVGNPAAPPAPIVSTVISSFVGNATTGGIALLWTTASEYNNKGFEVDRRLSGTTQWQAITFVNGAGTSTTPINYSYTDKSTMRGKTYAYRLKQVNLDGTSAYTVALTLTSR